MKGGAVDGVLAKAPAAVLQRGEWEMHSHVQLIGAADSSQFQGTCR